MKPHALSAMLAVFWGSAACVSAQFNMNFELRNNSCQYQVWADLDDKPVGVVPATGYVARGFYDNQGIWLIHPEKQPATSALIRPGDGSQRITFLTVPNREYMVVTAEGPARRWAYNTNDKGFFFKVVNMDPVWTAARQQISASPSFSLLEGTRGEYLSAAPDGILRRWSYSRNSDQKFRIQRKNCKAPPPATAVPTPQFPKDQIPAPDTERPMTSTDVSQVPQKLREYVVDSAVLSSLVVEDSRFSDKMAQWEGSPFYVLVHKQYYDRGTGRGDIKNVPPAGLTQAWSYSTQNGFSSQNMSSVSRTIGWEISSGVKGTIEGGSGKKCERGCVQGGAEVNLEGKYSDTMTTMSSSGQSNFQTVTETVTNTVTGVGQEYLIAAWALVDKFELRDYTGQLVQTWESVNRFNRIHQWYPRTIPAPVK